MMLHRHFESIEAKKKANEMLVKEGHDIPVNAETDKQEKPKRTRKRKTED